MKKKLLSIIMSLVMIFTIIPNSIVFANEESKDHPNSVDLINQDGLDGSITLKSGSGFKFDYPFGGCDEYFEGLYNQKDKSKINEDEYDGWQIMKIQIKISKKSGLEVKEIIPDNYKEVVPTRIKEAYKEYFELQEDDTEYVYNYYMKGNGTYSFTIRYSLDGVEKESKVSYKTKENLLNIPDVNMMTALYVGFGDSMAWSDDEDYVTEEFLNETRIHFEDGVDGTIFGENNNTIQYILPKIKSIEGVQYLSKLLDVRLSGGYSLSNIESIEPLSKGYYEKLYIFRVTDLGELSPKIPESSYTPELIRSCVSKMPNLSEFTCRGTKYKDFKVFDKLNGNLNYITADKNEVESLDGIQKHIGLGTLGIQKNKVSDLTPLYRCKDLEHFTGYNQSVEKKDPVLATKTENKIRIELPMPIDIDGNLTEVGKIVPPNTSITEKNNVKATYDSEDINYTAFEENGKIYIELSKSDFDNKAEEILDDIKFEFNFHNCNGKDNRTKDKFNGVVNFKATFNPPVEEYRVLYEFVSGTRGKGLPVEVTNLLPVDSNKYLEGQKITAIQPTQTKVEVENGIWKFKEYDTDGADGKIANEDNDVKDKVKDGCITFTGKWVFEKKAEKATLKYTSENISKNEDNKNDKNPLDVESIDILKYIKLPEDKNEYDIGKVATIKYPINKDTNKEIKPEDRILIEYEVPGTKIKTYVEMHFVGYKFKGELLDLEKKEIDLKDKENELKAVFNFTDMEKVHYDFISDKGKEIPKDIEDKIKKDFKDFEENEILYDGNRAVPKEPINKNIKDDNGGTWTFVGWVHKEDDGYKEVGYDGIAVHHDEEIIGVWHFEPKSTGGGTVTPTPNPNPTPDTEDPDRIEGDDRIETSIEASKDLYPNGTNAVVLANAERFSDVLTANPFAVQEKASALLTYKNKLPEKTLKEIERLGAKKIYVSGGYEAVSKKVVDELAAKGYEIYRFDGVDRYDTARKIAIKIREKGNTNAIELASGEDFPDALCMTPLAVKDKAPILLTKKDSIPKYTKQALAEWDIENIKIGGLDEAVSKEVEKQIKSGFAIDKNSKKDSNVYDGAKAIKRIGGANRYETSAKLAAESYPESKLGVYATGEDFPDALIAGNYAGRKEAPVLLVKRDSLPGVIEKYTEESKIERATIIGGVNAVSDKVFNLIKYAINR